MSLEELLWMKVKVSYISYLTYLFRRLHSWQGKIDLKWTGFASGIFMIGPSFDSSSHQVILYAHLTFDTFHGGSLADLGLEKCI